MDVSQEVLATQNVAGKVGALHVERVDAIQIIKQINVHGSNRSKHGVDGVVIVST